jgi:hypothetical protein
MRSPFGKKYPHVTRPSPVETSRGAAPVAASMTYSWSHSRPSRVDWKMSWRPSKLKYASAFSPPKVSCRTLRRCRSPGSASSRAVEAGALGAAGARAQARNMTHNESELARSMAGA